jgi:hypothetical protein
VVNGGNAPSLIAINAHYSPQALGPARSSDPAHPADPDVNAVDLTGQADLRRRLLLTMGCHSGFSITNYLAGTGSGASADWPEATAGEPVSAFVGNTGYGIGVRDLNAFSQKLFGDFAELIGQTSFGSALQQAKQRYLANGVTNPYDYKVIAQATYFGIPQYTLAGATPAPAPPAAPTPAPNASNGGLLTSSLSFSQSTTAASTPWHLHTADDGQYWTIDGGSQAIAQNRPVQPQLTRDVTAPGQTAAGAFITDLRIGADQNNFDPLLARPVVDDSAREPELQFSDFVFPTSLVNVTNFSDATGTSRQQATAIPAQFTASGLNAAGKVKGLERRFDRVGYDVLYRPVNATDITAPVLSQATAVQNDAIGRTVFSVHASDPESNVARVAVLYRKADENGFTLLDLVRDADDPTLFKASAPVDSDIDFVVQALNSQALVGLTGNKGRYYDETAAPGNPDTVTVTYNSPPDGGVFHGPVTVFLTQTPNPGPIRYTLDNGADTAYTNVGIPVSGTGTHVIRYETDSGLTGNVQVTIQPLADEVVSVTFDASPNATGYFTSVVTAHVSSNDPNSTITIKKDGAALTAFPNNDVPYTTEGTHSLVYQTSRGSTNSAAPREFKIDLNPPTVNLATPPAGTPSYNVGDVITVAYSCADAFTPLACVGSQANGTTLDTATPTATGTTRSVTVTATDPAGRVTTVAHDYKVVSTGVTTPTVTITTPPNGASYVVKQRVNADYACTNVTTGGCVGSVANGTPIDTNTVTNGVTPRAFTVTGTDALGHVVTKTNNYSVRYAASTACGHKISGAGDAGLLTQLRITF